MKMPEFTDQGAEFSLCERHRFRLWRYWNTSLPIVGFCMLNPSTADDKIMDPTVRRCFGYAVSWGYGGFEVVNIFSLRSTDPAKLYEDEDSGFLESNLLAIRDVAVRSKVLVAAWGTDGAYKARGAIVRAQVSPLYYLRLTKEGFPAHPLYLPSNLEPKLWC